MAMASTLKPPPSLHRHSSLISVSSCPIILSFPHCKTTSGRFRACTLRTGSDGGRVGNPESYGSDLLRKPSILPEKDLDAISEEDEDIEEKEKFVTEVKEWIDWEDQILADTVPLVGFVRMILHSDKYKSGERLSPEHERTIVERLLPHHPECEKKIGCGIDYITVGYHPDFVGSRCLFIVRKDGELVDFSYWKCIKGLIRKNYPLYADSFILRHFRRRRRNG